MLLSESNYYQLGKEVMLALPSTLRKKGTPNGYGRKEKKRMYLFVTNIILDINKFNISNSKLLLYP